MSQQMTCGEALVELLEKYEVDTVFGIPGVHTLDMYRGLASSKIKHVQARHEQGAGFMADGYARTTGKPGVCMLITGPGVTNATTALGQSFADSIVTLREESGRLVAYADDVRLGVISAENSLLYKDGDTFHVRHAVAHNGHLRLIFDQ